MQYRIQLAHDSLERIRMLKRRKDAAIALASEFTGVRGVDYQRETVQTSPSDEALVNLVEKRKERKDEMDAAIAEYECEIFAEWKRINSIGNSTYVKLLVFRYLKDFSWDDVANEIGYSIHYTTHYLKDCSLIEYYDVMSPENKAPKSV